MASKQNLAIQGTPQPSVSTNSMEAAVVSIPFDISGAARVRPLDVKGKSIPSTNDRDTM
jgi:hypothetical protein